MNSKIDELNKLLSQGILPDELNFSLQSNEHIIDIEKLKYNSFYRSYEFVESKFPKGYENIPGFDKVIQSIADELKLTSPLEEITKRSIINTPLHDE